MASLTVCWHTIIMVGIITVRKHKARPGMKSLTLYQGNGTIVKTVCQWGNMPSQICGSWLTSCEYKNGRVGLKWVKEHSDVVQNSSQTIKITRQEWGDKQSKKYSARHKRKLFTSWKGNKNRVVVKTMRTQLAGPDMKFLTYCQANRSRVGVKTVRRQ